MVKRIAAVGNFDGVHIGHQRLLAETASFAAARGAEPAAVVFDPHPRRFFQPDAPPFLLTTPARREKLLLVHGALSVETLRFDAALAASTPEEFVVRILKNELALAGVVVGSEFRFGEKRAGDAAALSSLGSAAGLDIRIVDPERDGAGGEKIGSSAIRAAIAGGRMAEAALMLGRSWAVEGVVEKGQALGRTIGFPTANFGLGAIIEPRRGVYAVHATIAGRAWPGVANFGRRPTVGAPAPLLETHLFDFSGDLYGKALEISFAEFIRDERKFDGVEALRAQIAEDCDAARRILARPR